ncbi:MAG TPA: SurA N-terminal domain-containing protein [Gallionellaceae bacterium]|nr:SurA N-terminal domain-containing protein [Gallionellaceae bacterium]
MFDFVHERKRLVQIVLLLIILPFAFWGVDSYRKAAGGDAPATVDGEKITQQELDAALRQQQDRMRELLGANFDPAIFDNPEVRRSILDKLVNQKLMVMQARHVGLTVSDDQLAQLIAGIRAFQKDDKFDKQRYVQVLKSQNMTPQIFQDRVTQELTTRQLVDAYTQNGFASQSAADNLIRLNEQQRVVSVAQLTDDEFIRQAKVDDGAVKDYFDRNQNEFRSPEKIKAEYVIFSAASLQNKVSVEQNEIKQYYEDHQSEFGTPEQRKASHIQIKVAASASDAEKQAAKAKADDILQQVKRAPGSFAELARKYSQDAGSAANGGDLGFFGRGLMGPAFDDAAFKLMVGEISGVVQSDSGFHIIKLTAIQEAKRPSLDSVKSTIAQKLKAQKAEDSFAELSEKFSNTVYEQSDSLKPAAEIAKAPIQQVAWLNKGQPAVAPWTDKVMQALFSDDVIKNKRNTAAIEVGPNTLMAARMVDYKPASTLPFAEVADSIRQKLQRQQAHDLAIKQGQAVLSQLQQGKQSQLSWKAAQTVTRSQHTGMDNDVARLVFQTGIATLPAYAGMESAQGGYRVIRIDAVKEVDSIDPLKRAGYEEQLRKMTGEELAQANLADARKRATIHMKTFSPEEAGK